MTIANKFSFFAWQCVILVKVFWFTLCLPTHACMVNRGKLLVILPLPLC
jgi:hypothetical protein